MKIKEVPATIAEIQESLFKKKFSVVDLVDYYLDRIKTYNPDLNSFLTITKDSAISQAKEADIFQKVGAGETAKNA